MEAYFKRLDASCSNSSSSDDSKPDVKPDPYRRDSGFADSTASHDLKPDISQDLKPDINSGVTLHLDGIQNVPAFEGGESNPDLIIEKARTLSSNLELLLKEENFGKNGGKRHETFKADLKKLKEKLNANPQFVVAVVGSTGAGKSSLINALLHTDSLVPTNSMRACTAVVTEISYNYTDSNIRAEVEFLTPAEWRAELIILRGDLLDDDGNIRRVVDENSEAGAAWARVHSVYPTLHRLLSLFHLMSSLSDFDQTRKCRMGHQFRRKKC